MKHVDVKEIIRFCITGGICTCIDACVFYVVQMVACYQIALVAGYSLGLVVNYFLTMYWTFKKEPSTKSAIAVITAHLINLFVVRMGSMYVLVDTMGLNDKLAYIPTLLISVIVNYIMVKIAVTITK